jgi:hypothetical protein
MIREHHTVYLAGKVRMNGWRNAFGYRNNVDFYSMEKVEDFANYLFEYNDSLSITGPTIIGCDHGCYHGPEAHGCGIDQCGCGGHNLTREDVFNICKRQIDRAEIVFAYIDSYDCFGTIAEIGYAYAQGKSILVKFATEELRRDMWFVDQMKGAKPNISAEWINKELLNRI